MTRENALKRFFSALEINDFEIKEKNTNSVSGTVFYDRNDPDEFQDFCWHINEKNIPSEQSLLIADLIADNNLIDIDQITINREELWKLYQNKYDKDISFIDFEKHLDVLLGIKVSMIDDGVETDAFFIHEQIHE